MPEAGDTFILTHQQTRGTPHLWVLLWGPTGTADAFLAVYLTTLRQHSDRTCILVPGDHPFIRRETAVAYNETIRITAERLTRAFQNGNASTRQPVSAAVLEAIRKGFFVSEGTPHDFKDMARQQFDAEGGDGE
jgi:molybdopterin-guanine dinucleotide biosynthesis protein A